MSPNDRSERKGLCFETVITSHDKELNPRFSICLVWEVAALSEQNFPFNILFRVYGICTACRLQ
jgi:hypothetical protein